MDSEKIKAAMAILLEQAESEPDEERKEELVEICEKLSGKIGDGE